MNLVSSPTTPVTLASFPVESFFYGVFLLLFSLSSALFWYRHRCHNQLQRTGSGTVVRPVLVLSVLIFFTVTAHWVVAWLYYFSSIIQQPVNTAHISYATLKSIFVVSSVLLADTSFIYRLWTVWGNNTRVIIFPCLTLAGLMATGSNIIMAYVTMDLNKPESQKVFRSWVLVDITFTICTNVYCTIFISWKIWKVTQQAQMGGTTFSLQDVLAMVIESAGFYTSWMVAAFGLNLAGSPIVIIFIDANPAAAAIAFMLINVRVGLGWAATQGRTWRGAIQESQFKVTEGELRFALTPESSILSGAISVDGTNTEGQSDKPSEI